MPMVLKLFLDMYLTSVQWIQPFCRRWDFGKGSTYRLILLLTHYSTRLQRSRWQWLENLYESDWQEWFAWSEPNFCASHGLFTTLHLNTRLSIRVLGTRVSWAEGWWSTIVILSDLYISMFWTRGGADCQNISVMPKCAVSVFWEHLVEDSIQNVFQLSFSLNGPYSRPPLWKQLQCGGMSLEPWRTFCPQGGSGEPFGTSGGEEQHHPTFS